MMRYFFHVRDSAEIIDHDGVDCAGIEEARTMAVKAAAEALKDLGGKFWKAPEWQLWVTDESGATVCSLSFLADRLEAA
jgi:hypothetical protein